MDTPKDSSWDSRIENGIGKGKSLIGNIDSILKRCILMNIVVPKSEYVGQECEWNANLTKQLQTVQMAGAKNISVRARTTSDTEL